MQVADLISAGQQVEGDLARPGWGIDEVRGTAERGELREDAVDGCLQGRDLAGQGEGPRALQRQDVGVVAVQPAVSERQCGVEGRLLDVGQQSRGDPLVHVGGCLPCRQIDGQLVHHRFQGVGCRNSRQRCVVGRSDAAVHRSRRGVIG